MNNLIIGYGETLTTPVTIKSGSGPKSHPYSIREARDRVSRQLRSALPSIKSKTPAQCSNGKVVVKITQHPTYLAKTYYPKPLFKKTGLRDLGSKSVELVPEKWSDPKKKGEKGVASCIYVEGGKSDFENLLAEINSDEAEKTFLKQIQTIESIEVFDGIEKIKNIDAEGPSLRLEIVLHIAPDDRTTYFNFKSYVEGLNGTVEEERVRSVGGLTFLPVRVLRGAELQLAEFSHLRVLRSVPKLRFNKPASIRSILGEAPELPDSQAIDRQLKVAIFDGGVGDNHLLGGWVNEIIPEGLTKTHPKLLAHGGDVCSTYLFGPVEGEISVLPVPYSNVDVIRVIDPDDNDPDLFDVLDRIESQLKQQKYKFINLSLGPRIPISDDEVNVWTSTLDRYLQEGDCFACVAAGNDGELEGEDARIQPPSDMVNCLSVGSCNSNKEDWTRSKFSCIGPGRSPGLIKPDGVAFGGEEDNLFKLYCPQTHSLIGTMGTSFSSPFALRVAAGIDAITEFELLPATIKALMIHNCEEGSEELSEIGWGRLPRTAEEVISCTDDEATIMYQGELPQSGHLRIPIPVPSQFSTKKVNLKATFCINAFTDPEHPLHYTRSGLDISFRPNSQKKEDDKEHSKTTTFFSTKKLYDTEQVLRDDAHKWETCISRSQNFMASSLDMPIFDVKYHSREQGGTPDEAHPPIKYSLIVSIKAKGMNDLYNGILQRYRTLQSLKLRSRVRV